MSTRFEAAKSICTHPMLHGPTIGPLVSDFARADLPSRGAAATVDVLAPYDSDEDAVGAGEKETGQILLSHPVRHRV